LPCTQHPSHYLNFIMFCDHQLSPMI
jgi:hypothetical protein